MMKNEGGQGAMNGSFSDRLRDAVLRCRTPVLVGLDPRFESLPSPLRRSRSVENPADVASAYREFCQAVIDVVAGVVPAVKPQAAFFEEAGPAGMQALADTIDYARQAGLLVIVDGKRNDIGSTAAAYANAYLGRIPASRWGADALTVSPYLGDDSLLPFVERAQQQQAGVFVLVKTSNPGGGLFQDLIADGRRLFEHVADYVESLARQTLDDEQGFGAVGAVVGATYPEQLDELRGRMPHAWFLVPGYGAQGGAAADVAAAFRADGLGAIINNSRGILFAYQRAEYKTQYGEARWQEAVAAATQDMIDQLRAHTPAGALGVNEGNRRERRE
jgi:orotidine-5'-phosphate decarboxylase